MSVYICRVKEETNHREVVESTRGVSRAGGEEALLVASTAATTAVVAVPRRALVAPRVPRSVNEITKKL